MNAPEPTDTALWEAFKQGDQRAHSELMNRHYRPLYSYGTKLSVDKELVKDCIQDVFLELWQRREAIAAAESPRFYLLRALQRRIHRQLTRHSPFNQADELDENAAFEVELSVESTLIQHQEQAERSRQVTALLETLSPRQKQLIYLRFFQELDHSEIAGLMQISHQSVYNLLREALLRLRQLGRGALLLGLFFWLG